MKHLIGRKSLISFFCAIFLLFLDLPFAKADTVNFPCGANQTYSVLMPQGVLLDGKKCSGSLIIDQSVKIIGTRAFNGNYNITEVTFPNSLTTIDEAAFQSSSLSSVLIPNSVTSISRYAFSFTKLTSINLPNSLSTITDQSFRGTLISSITIPDSVRVIELGAFMDTQLSSIVFGKNLSEIGSIAFQNTKFVNVILPDSIKVLGSKVFGNIPNLQSISYPDGLQTIGTPTFESNYSLNKILFCGNFPMGTFPVSPTCPPERQAIIDAAKAASDAAAKAAADKVAADAKAAADLKARQDAEFKANSDAALKVLIDQVSASKEELVMRINTLVKKFPSETKKLLSLSQAITNLGIATSTNYKVIEAELYRASGQIDYIEERLLTTRTTITCVKGKLTKKVTAVKPKCPAGYKVKK
jgi:hypothetical protein